MRRGISPGEFSRRLQLLGQPGQILWLAGDDDCELVVSEGPATALLEQQAGLAGDPLRRGIRVRLGDGTSFVADTRWLCTPAEMTSRWYVLAPGGQVAAIRDDEAGAWDEAAGRGRGYTCRRGHPALGPHPQEAR